MDNKNTEKEQALLAAKKISEEKDEMEKEHAATMKNIMKYCQKY